MERVVKLCKKGSGPEFRLRLRIKGIEVDQVEVCSVGRELLEPVVDFMKDKMVTYSDRLVPGAFVNRVKRGRKSGISGLFWIVQPPPDLFGKRT